MKHNTITPNKIFSALLILVGSFLEIYFYYYRFTQDGLSPLICAVIAVSLSLLLCMATYNMRTSKKWLWLLIPVFLYSVFSTSAGQTFVLINKENVTVTNTIIKSSESKSDQTQKEIDRLNAEADGLVAANAKYDTPELQAKYRTTMQKNRDRLDAINVLLDKKSTVKETTDTSKSETQKQSIKATSIYEFYGSITTWTATDLIKFIFHTILSIFIAIMAPVGIATWNRKRDDATVSDASAPKEINPSILPYVLQNNGDIENHDTHNEEAEPTTRVLVTTSDIDRYVKWTWYRMREKTDSHVLPRETILAHLGRIGQPLDEHVYDVINQSAHEAGLINDDDVIRVADEKIANAQLKELLCKK